MVFSKLDENMLAHASDWRKLIFRLLFSPAPFHYLPTSQRSRLEVQAQLQWYSTQSYSRYSVYSRCQRARSLGVFVLDGLFYPVPKGILPLAELESRRPSSGELESPS